MIIKHLILILFFSTVSFCSAQNPLKYEEKPFYLGLGGGIDFGGIGAKAEYMFFDYGGVFIGGGMPLRIKTIVVNGGIMLKPLPRKLITPYFFAMYGLNSFIYWEQNSKIESHYNFSFGSGFEIKTRNLNKWQFGAILPIRSDDFMQYYESLNNNPNVNLLGRLYPVLISVGFKLLL
jgi:hypothetical protein